MDKKKYLTRNMTTGRHLRWICPCYLLLIFDEPIRLNIKIVY